MDEGLMAIDIMNYLFTHDFMSEWMSSEEMRIMDRTIMKGKNREVVSRGWSAEEFISRMNEGKYEKVLIAGLQMFSHLNKKFMAYASVDQVYEQVKKYPDRLVGIAGYNTLKIKESLQEIEKGVKEYNFKGVYAHVHGFGIPLNDRKMYPCYAKCAELGVPIILQTGHALELQPSEVGRPIYLDEVALDFRELAIIGSHTGWPWCEELIALAWKHENVYLDISAHLPKYLDKSVVQFMDTRGRDKVMFGTNGFPFALSIFRNQFLELKLKEETKRKVLRENAIRVFKL
jgi:predicted TIM-barrel fold metal-dependent hydrolase